MKIVVAGGHGKIAMLLHPILKEKGHKVTGLIRKEEQVDDLKEAGAESVVVDIEKEDDISEFVGDADAVVFAAGAGPGSGKDRKWSVDRDGAIKLIEAAKKNGIDKYVMISAMGLDTPRGDDVFQVYQQAKAQADEALRNSGLNYVIIKPGRLTNDEGTGKVKIAEKLDRGEIPREDVARVIAEVLDNNSIKNVEFDLLSGKDEVTVALQEFV
ncbi:SDR family oxidoreductase [Rhodohalobacter barkolensis]|uniref:NAD-dependent dehydratase n=1 Tax=Rhodohalobacter barkolensis TaxID=2053187 RepID=A0A2N0VEM5_9BACT|nr:SDR family oxidoreductase [Rhodohalobacter barkolensis]PKD42610.1 NAD-dependent dehydratase [Rhodohalobacter barkolensis]